METQTTPLKTPTLADFDLAEWFVNIPDNANNAEADLDFEAWRASLAANKGDTATTMAMTTSAAHALSSVAVNQVVLTPTTQAALDSLIAPTHQHGRPGAPAGSPTELTAASLADLSSSLEFEDSASVPTPGPVPSGAARRSVRSVAKRTGATGSAGNARRGRAGNAPVAKRARKAAEEVTRASPGLSQFAGAAFDHDDLASEFGGSTLDGGFKGGSKKSMNKVAADRYRRKKRAEFQQLQEQSTTLTAENKSLRSRCERLEVEVSTLRDILLGAVRQSASAVAIARALGVEPAAADLEAEARLQ
jgi:hypothetical protein